VSRLVTRLRLVVGSRLVAEARLLGARIVRPFRLAGFVRLGFDRVGEPRSGVALGRLRGGRGHERREHPRTHETRTNEMVKTIPATHGAATSTSIWVLMQLHCTGGSYVHASELRDRADGFFSETPNLL
jgi:hypothetical protein